MPHSEKPANSDKPWTSEALSMLTALWNYRPVIAIPAIAARLGRTASAIETCATRFGLPAREYGDLDAAAVSLRRGAMRVCIVCEVNAFWSSGPQHRLCADCRRDPESGQARRGHRLPDVVIAAAELEVRPEELKQIRRKADAVPVEAQPRKPVRIPETPAAAAADDDDILPLSKRRLRRSRKFREHWDQVFRDQIAEKRFREMCQLYPPHGPRQPPYVDANGEPVLPELKRRMA